MNEFEKKLNKVNEDIENTELQIVKLEFDLKYLKILIKKLQEKKLKILNTYRF